MTRQRMGEKHPAYPMTEWVTNAQQC